MILLREATMDDFNNLYKLEEHINNKVLKRKIECKEIFLILNDDKIIGWLRYSLFWDEHPFINMLYILKEHRYKGYGKKLVAYWEDKMRENGFKILMTSTLSNENSQHFYRSIGYKDIGGFTMPKEPLELILIKELI